MSRRTVVVLAGVVVTAAAASLALVAGRATTIDSGEQTGSRGALRALDPHRSDRLAPAPAEHRRRPDGRDRRHRPRAPDQVGRTPCRSRSPSSSSASRSCVLVHLFLAFPSGRLSSRFERRLVAFSYAAWFVFSLAGQSLWDPRADDECPGCPRNLLLVDANHTVAGAIGAVGTVVVVVVLATTAVLVVRRVRHATGPDAACARARSRRRGRDDSPVLCAARVRGHRRDGRGRHRRGRSSWIPFMLIPVAFLVGLLRTRMHRSRVAELVVALGSASQPAEVRDAIARTLRDPSLELAFWLPDSGRYVDPDGRELSARRRARPRRDGARARGQPARRARPRPRAARRPRARPRGRRRRHARARELAPPGRAARPARRGPRLPRPHRRSRRRRAPPARARPPRRRPAAPARDPARAPARPRTARRRRRRPRPAARRSRHRSRRRARRAARARPRHPPRHPHRRRTPRRPRRARPARPGPGRAHRRHRPPPRPGRGHRLLRHRRSARQHRQTRPRHPRDRRHRTRERPAHRRDRRRRHRRRRHRRPRAPRPPRPRRSPRRHASASTARPATAPTSPRRSRARSRPTRR